MPRTSNPRPKRVKKIVPPCGLCGKKRKPRFQTECCGHWVCDDETSYVLFSYARNCCARNHRRYTLCGYHHAEGHEGDWKTCKECLDDFSQELEMYVWYGTNEYNFEALEHPPEYEPTHCAGCKQVIRLGEDEYTSLGSDYACRSCMDKGFDLRATGKTRKKAK